MKVELTRITHNGWKEFQQIKELYKTMNEKIPIKNHFGKYQYIYENVNGKISLIKTLCYNNTMYWEIYSWGKLFDDIERFRTRKQAEVRIMEILGVKK